MKVYYDLHIHTALSPCGDDDMTPCNIVGLAALCGLDVIAVTDHNSALNCAAVEKAGREAGIIVLSGMELETAEGVHVVLLFPSAAAAEECGKEVGSRRLLVPNKPDIYGSQLIMSHDDRVVGEEKNLLVTATDIGVYETVELARKYGGVAFPAHIDRPSHGILQMLGDIDEDMGFTAVEISSFAGDEFVNKWINRGYTVMRNSDAHYLENINQRSVNFLELDSLTPQSVLRKLGRR